MRDWWGTRTEVTFVFAFQKADAPLRWDAVSCWDVLGCLSSELLQVLLPYTPSIRSVPWRKPVAKKEPKSCAQDANTLDSSRMNREKGGHLAPMRSIVKLPFFFHGSVLLTDSRCCPWEIAWLGTAAAVGMTFNN